MRFRHLFVGLLVAGVLAGSQPLRSQAGREKVLEGNRSYSEGEYDKALELYREALEESPDSPAIRFNLGDALFKKEEMEDAADSFSEALQSEDPEIKSRAQYNLGNSLYRQGKLQESLSAYREALKVAPGDRDAKHNLEFVLKQLQEQQQQQQQQNQDQQGEGEQEEDQDKNQDENRSGSEDQSQQGRQDQPEDQEGQDQQNEEQRSQARNDRQDSEDSEQRPADRQEETPQEDQAQSSPDGAQPMSREEAERLLEALAQAQAGVKKKLEMQPGTVKVEKDW